MKKYLLLVSLLVFLAACGDDSPTDAVVLPTQVVLPTLTETSTPTTTLTGTQTATLNPTPTPTSSLTPTVTVTPSITITDTPTSTPTVTPSPTPSVGALGLLAQLAAQATPIPQTLLPPVIFTQAVGAATPSALSVTCANQPAGGFAGAYAADPTLNTLIGCPQGNAETLNSAVQTFERGSMIWLQGPIYVLYLDGRFQQFVDTYAAGVDPESGGEVPPAGLVEPVRGFGKAWRSNPDVRTGLGWGTSPENGNQAAQQRFDRGWMIYLPQRGDILVLEDSGTWRSISGSY